MSALVWGPSSASTPIARAMDLWRPPQPTLETQGFRSDETYYCHQHFRTRVYLVDDDVLNSLRAFLHVFFSRPTIQNIQLHRSVATGQALHAIIRSLPSWQTREDQWSRFVTTQEVHFPTMYTRSKERKKTYQRSLQKHPSQTCCSYVDQTNLMTT